MMVAILSVVKQSVVKCRNHPSIFGSTNTKTSLVLFLDSRNRVALGST